jgi:hypothetical protein
MDPAPRDDARRARENGRMNTGARAFVAHLDVP